MGAGDFRTGEGFGYVVGGVLCIVMGFVVFPVAFGGLAGPSGVKYFYWGMGVIGLYLAIRGILQMRGEDKTPRVPITDEEFEEAYQHDLARAKEEAESAICLTYGIPRGKRVHPYGRTELLYGKPAHPAALESRRERERSVIRTSRSSLWSSGRRACIPTPAF